VLEGDGGRGLQCTRVGVEEARAVRKSRSKRESLILEMGVVWHLKMEKGRGFTY